MTVSPPGTRPRFPSLARSDVDPQDPVWHHPKMSSASRLGRQIQEVLASLGKLDASSALIGGLALAPYRVVRATQDVDLLTHSADADAIHAELLRLGYRCIHRSEDAANYLRGDERVDLLYARRPIAQRLLEEAGSRDTAFGPVRVVSLEGLIAFKLQGLVNDPRRTQDLEVEPRGADPSTPHLAADGGVIEASQDGREPYAALDDLMVVVEALCPQWPARATFGPMPDMRL